MIEKNGNCEWGDKRVDWAEDVAKSSLLMSKKQSISEMIHSSKNLRKGEIFLRQGMPCEIIGMVEKGVLRGYVVDNDGEEITTHFFQENDMVIGSFIPNTNMAMSVDALEDSELSIANYAEVMSWVNRDMELTSIINKQFGILNQRLQSRLVNLINLNSMEKYELFMQEHPSLLNRIPHYYIANYLGITPTQLSRTKKQFLNKCK